MEIENSPNRESVTVTLLMFQAKRIPPALSTKGRKFQLLNRLPQKALKSLLSTSSLFVSSKIIKSESDLIGASLITAWFFLSPRPLMVQLKILISSTYPISHFCLYQTQVPKAKFISSKTKKAFTASASHFSLLFPFPSTTSLLVQLAFAISPPFVLNERRLNDIVMHCFLLMFFSKQRFSSKLFSLQKITLVRQSTSSLSSPPLESAPLVDSTKNSLLQHPTSSQLLYDPTVFITSVPFSNSIGV